ncbi:hypothetical protein [Nocardia terpenica]|nr:hypothetical protein [Nocardia terpenica]NQE86245.1 hypothetical protein [Nocardia terpenica]
MSDLPGYMTAQECADEADVELRTWHAYVNRPTKTNPAPKPKVKVGSTPLWDENEFRAWKANRPGSPVRNNPADRR